MWAPPFMGYGRRLRIGVASPSRRLVAPFHFAPGVHDAMAGYLRWRFWSVGAYVADAVMGLGSIDIVLGEVDR